MPLTIEPVILDSLPDQGEDTTRTTLLIDASGQLGAQTAEQATACLNALVGFVETIASINDVDPETIHVRVQTTDLPGPTTTTTGFDGVDPANGTNPPEGE